MNKGRVIIVSTVLLCAVPGAVALAGTGEEEARPPRLVEQVRDATRDFRNVANAVSAGYASTGSCVSGPQEGAMGVHFAKGDLIGDGQVAADQPELLVYEQRGGQMRLLGVEFLVLAEDWDAAHPDGTPPVLAGQHFHHVNSPNRYRLPAFYELHVWAWKDNPNGTFADWNPAVSCNTYTGEADPTHGGHGG